jgi:hypothetical protein
MFVGTNAWNLVALTFTQPHLNLLGRIKIETCDKCSSIITYFIVRG